jgi:hypothetical protein
MALFLAVIASGVWGLTVQQFLPQRMLDDIPAETIYSQIVHVSGLLAAEGDRLIEAVCGPAADDGRAKPVSVPQTTTTAPHGFVVVGALRSAGGLRGKVLLTQGGIEPVPNSEPLREFFQSMALPYLKQGAASGSPLAQASRSATLFIELRDGLTSPAHPGADTLEALCDQRRQFDLEIRLHRWLHNWLWVHLPLSIALILLMFIHIWVALKYI